MKKQLLLAAVASAAIASCSPHHDSTNSSMNGALDASSNSVASNSFVVSDNGQTTADQILNGGPSGRLPVSPPMNDVTGELDVKVVNSAVPSYSGQTMTFDRNRGIVVKSKTNTITINKVVVNDGNCELEFGNDEAHTINAGDTYNFNLEDASCPVSKVHLETDQGNAEYSFGN